MPESSSIAGRQELSQRVIDQRLPKLNSSYPTYISLFSGCGGLDVGFAKHGFTCVGAFENNAAAARVHKSNLDGPVWEEDLSTIQVSCLPRADVLIAGPPCQGFSTAGRRDPNDPRNQLLLRTAKLAAALAPSVVIIENVTGVVAGSLSVFWADTKKYLAAAGYCTQDIRFDSSTLGVPQIRCRQLLVAWNTKFDGKVELPSLSSRTLRDALNRVAGLPNHEPKWLEPQSDGHKIAKRIRQRQKLCNVRSSERSVHTWEIPEVFGKTNAFERSILKMLLLLRRRNRCRDFGDADPVSARTLYNQILRPVSASLGSLIQKGYVRRVGNCYDLAHTFNGKYRRLAWDHPASTVDTRFGDPRYFLHPVENRGFSVREAARIQGFADDFVFDGTIAEQFKMVGNAVPPPVSAAIAAFVRNHILPW